jgi:uncharacterized repeat protein (TIGR01451 family)
MNISNTNIMKTILQSGRLASVAFVFAVILVLPQISMAQIPNVDDLFQTNGAFDLLNSGTSNSGNGNNIVQTTCNISVNNDHVVSGGSVIISWEAQGFSNITISGQSVSGESGSITVTNITSNRIFQLAAINGANVCAAQVLVTCIPPPVLHCELEITKVVDKSTAQVGDELTYTIKVKNVGNGNCTGNGVKIEDQLDPHIEYLEHTLTSNLQAGYLSNPVYKASNRTLYFNGDVLTPGEEGTIVWVGKVTAPEQCGDFTIKNQAKTTAKELNNFLTWVKSSYVSTDIDHDCPPPSVPSCDSFIANPSSVLTGSSTTLSWSTTNATHVSIDNGIGSVADDGSIVVTPLVSTTYNLTVYGTNNQTAHCSIPVTVTNHPAPTCDSFTATPNLVMVGDSILLSWETTNANNVSINNGVGVVALDGTATVTPLTSTTYKLTVQGAQNQSVECSVPVTVTNYPVPSCDAFSATPNTIMVGDEVLLSWETSNATNVSLDNGIGNVLADGTATVTPLTSTTYKLTVQGAQNQSVECSVPVTVSNDEVPVCKYFTATPSMLPVGGGTVTFAWDVEKATAVSISPTIGSVSLVGTTTRTVTSATTYVLTAVDADGDEVTCPAPVTIADPEVFTCGNNVDFTSSDYSISRGQSVTLQWNVTGADSVNISQINETSFSGSESVSPNDDTTYILTATKNNVSIECPVTVSVSSGGGGGGSSSPRCDLDISKQRITLGERITLKWNTSRATHVTIEDDRGDVVVTTEDLNSKEREDLLDGEIELRPTRDTEYTLTATKGSKKRTCEVKVDIEGGQVLSQVRDQQPLVAGIALSNVPYTGFEAGPILTLMFYILLMAWALYIAYFIVARRKVSGTSAHLGTIANLQVTPMGTTVRGITKSKEAEDLRPDVFVRSTATSTAPANLPTSTAVHGYENYFEGNVTSESHADTIVTELENRAHEQRALLSGDAIALFLRATHGTLEREQMIDRIIADAKAQYPLEDGWIVINQTRMQDLCKDCTIKPVSVTDTLPMGSGSLAEAMVTGNIVAAYEMIGNRPMFALAEAAADLDSVVRHRKGDKSPISTMLLEETSKLSDEKLQAMISALTGALDGTYTDEPSAVKMAIMKAVKEIA